MAVCVHGAGQKERAGKASDSPSIRGRGECGDAPVGHVHREARLHAAIDVDEIGKEAHRRVDSTAPLSHAQHATVRGAATRSRSGQ